MVGLLEVRKAKEGKGRERRGEGHHPFCLVSVSMVRQKKDPKNVMMDHRWVIEGE